MRKTAVLLSLLAAACGGTAYAAPSPDLSIGAGMMIFEGREQLDAGPLIRISSGYDFNDRVGLEASFAFGDTRGKQDPRQVYSFIYKIESLLYLGSDPVFRPYVAGGIGGFSMSGSPVYGSTTSLLLDAGAGIKYYMLDNVALRGDARYVARYDSNDRYSAEVTLGVTYYFGERTRPAPAAYVPPVQERPAGIAPETPETPAPPQVKEPAAPAAPAAPTPVPAPLPEPAPATPPRPIPFTETAPAPVPATPGLKAIRDVNVTADAIEIVTEGRIDDFTTFTLSGPTRLVVDICCSFTALLKQVDVNRHGVTKVRFGNYPDKVRIVLDTDQKSFPRYEIMRSDRGIRIIFPK